MKTETTIEPSSEDQSTSKPRPAFSWAVPEELGIPPDQLRLRLDFFHQAVEMTFFDGETVTTRAVSAMDVAHALASELSFASGILPSNTLWWSNTKSGPVIAVYEAPGVRVLALQKDVRKPPKRYTIPLPGLIFICQPGTPPWIYAVKRRPTKESDIVYKAPMANIFANGRSCSGSHDYPNRVADIPESFFTSFFSETADLHNRSVKFPQNVIRLWESLNKKKKFPNNDLVEHAQVKDIMQYG